jgi:hypothetical protein
MVKTFLNELSWQQKELETLDWVLQPFFATFSRVQSDSGTCIITGELKLDNPRCDYHFSRTANVEIVLNPKNLIDQQPDIRVKELWMKQMPDWHCSNDNHLCWELQERWRDKLTEILRRRPPFDEFLKYAITWFLESSACLISRHWYAHTQNISKWPSEWTFWAHYGAGEKEYERKKRKKERKKTKRTH